jgi:hypothetical protein
MIRVFEEAREYFLMPGKDTFLDVRQTFPGPYTRITRWQARCRRDNPGPLLTLEGFAPDLVPTLFELARVAVNECVRA